MSNAVATARTDDLRNMTPFDEVVLEIDELYAEAKNWADGDPLASEDQHEAVSKLYDALHEAGKKAEALRVEEVKPLDEAKAAIQHRYHPLIGNTKAGKGKVVLGKDALGALLSAWRENVRREKEAAALKARIEAEEERRKAEEAMQASAGDLEARERAEEQLALAKEAEKFADRQEKRAATGNGLRTVYVPEIEDLSACISFYWKERRERFQDLVLELAAKDIRAGKRTIPGIRLVEKSRAI